MDPMIEDIIGDLHELRMFIWGKDIPFPATPEYREHHESIVEILGKLDTIIERIEQKQN